MTGVEAGSTVHWDESAERVLDNPPVTIRVDE